jgi:hypothetical protein
VMTELDPSDLTVEQLAAMLRAWAQGMYADEAAVGLLICHGHWLARQDFRTRCVDAVWEGWTRDAVAPLASIDWPAAAQLAESCPCSSSEQAMLLTACSLAGVDTGPLTVLTRSLDHANLALVLQAIAHRAGWHEQFLTTTVTGHLDDADHFVVAESGEDLR